MLAKIQLIVYNFQMTVEHAPHIDNIFTRYNRGARFTHDVVPVRESKITLESSKQMVRIYNKQILMEKPKAPNIAVNLEAIIKETRRVKSGLKQLQPEDKTMNLTKSRREEIKDLQLIKKHWGDIIAKIRKEVSKKPHRLTRFDPELLKKLHIQPRR